MTTNMTIDKSRTAILIMDYENEIVSMLSEDKQKMLLQNAKQVLDAARQVTLPVIFVAVRFRDGHPEISPKNKRFSRVKNAGRLVEGTKGADIHPALAPQPDEAVVAKRRVGAFSTTDLAPILKAKEIDTLVLLGIATHGVVLSTVCWAADMDYELVVVSDGCADFDEEVHRVLTEKIFPQSATVVTTEELVQALKSS
ncbi:cysteine hydrolase family protein [Chloroflexota bacterium]